MAITSQDVARLHRRELGSTKMRFRINLLGCGGVGSNLLMSAGACTRREEDSKLMFRVWDHDTVEYHNLNRTTLFTLRGVKYGSLKVMQAKNRFPSMIKEVGSMVSGSDTLPMGVVIDARDTLDPTKLIKGSWMKLAYDGGSNISFTWHPEVVARTLFSLDNSNSYAVVPSFFVPAALLGVFALRFLEFSNLAEITELRAGTMHLEIDQVARDISYQWEPTK